MSTGGTPTPGPTAPQPNAPHTAPHVGPTIDQLDTRQVRHQNALWITHRTNSARQIHDLENAQHRLERLLTRVSMPPAGSVPNPDVVRDIGDMTAALDELDRLSQIHRSGNENAAWWSATGAGEYRRCRAGLVSALAAAMRNTHWNRAAGDGTRISTALHAFSRKLGNTINAATGDFRGGHSAIDDLILDGGRIINYLNEQANPAQSAPGRISSAADVAELAAIRTDVQTVATQIEGEELWDRPEFHSRQPIHQLAGEIDAEVTALGGVVTDLAPVRALNAKMRLLTRVTHQLYHHHLDAQRNRPRDFVFHHERTDRAPFNIRQDILQTRAGLISIGVLGAAITVYNLVPSGSSTPNQTSNPPPANAPANPGPQPSNQLPPTNQNPQAGTQAPALTPTVAPATGIEQDLGVTGFSVSTDGTKLTYTVPADRQVGRSAKIFIRSTSFSQREITPQIENGKWVFMIPDECITDGFVRTAVQVYDGTNWNVGSSIEFPLK